MEQTGERFLQRVTIDITTRCNLRCIMCPQHHSTAPRFDMPLEIFRKLAFQVLPHTKELFFSCAYEALMSESFVPIMELTRQFRVPEYVLISNGTLLDARNAEKVIDAGVNTLIVSMDGAAKDVYERIRAGARYETLLENLRGIERLKRERGLETPRLNLTFTLMRSNIGEMPGLVELAASLGIMSVNFKPLQVHLEHMQAEALDAGLAGRIGESLSAAREAGRRLGVRVVTAPEIVRYVEPPAPAPSPSPAPAAVASAESPRRRCVEPFPSIYIRPTGEVFPCTIWKDAPIGDFRVQDFADMWSSADFTSLRAELTSGDFRPACARCCYVV